MWADHVTKEANNLRAENEALRKALLSIEGLARAAVGAFSALSRYDCIRIVEIATKARGAGTFDPFEQLETAKQAVEDENRRGVEMESAKKSARAWQEKALEMQERAEGAERALDEMVGSQYSREMKKERDQAQKERDELRAKLAEKERELAEARAANGKLVNAFERYGASNINYMERYYEEEARAQKAEDWAAKRWTKRVGELEAQLAEKEKELEEAKDKACGNENLYLNTTQELESARKAKEHAERASTALARACWDARAALKRHALGGPLAREEKEAHDILDSVLMTSDAQRERDYVHRSELERAEAKLAEMQGWHPPEMCKAEVERAREETAKSIVADLWVAWAEDPFFLGLPTDIAQGVAIWIETRALGEKKAPSTVTSEQVKEALAAGRKEADEVHRRIADVFTPPGTLGGEKKAGG